jgi:hypothetical protein
MNGMAQHASPGKRDHLWVLAVIAACALLEVWASWLGIGSVSGFPKLGKMTTGWILPVTTEAYWGYAVWAWLASSPGPRSRRFAMWTAIVMFTLSLGGQEAGHLVAAAHRQAPPYVVAFVTALPLIAVGLIAILIHLRQADREEAEATARAQAEAARLAAAERAEADERTALRRQLSDLRAEFNRELQSVTDRRDADMIDLRAQFDQSVTDLGIAQQEASEAVTRANLLDRRLASALAERKERAAGRKGNGAGSGRSATEAQDLSTELLALMALRENPKLCQPRQGAELARKLGVSAATGGRLHRKFTSNGSLNESVARSLMEATGD